MITAGLTNSFKEELLLGVHDFSTDVMKMALYTSSAVLGPSTTVYTTSGEVSGVGYTAGGEILVNVTVSLAQGIAFVSFDNPTWIAATFATRGALIYNSTKSNKSVGVLNFGIDQTMLSQQFQVQLPANNADNALIRVTWGGPVSIVQTATTSFKIQLLQGIHDFGPPTPDTFKIALYTTVANLGYSTTVYSATDEVIGPGYTAGGNTLTINPSPTAANNSAGIPTAYLSFSDTSWPNSTFTARGALIYNATEGNKSVAVLDFGINKTVNNDTFQIIFPTPDANSAIVRIS